MDDFEFIKKVKEMRAQGPAGVKLLREFLKTPGYLDRLFDLAIKGAGKPKKPPKNKARTSLPEGFPDAPMIEVAKGFWAQHKRRDLYLAANLQADEFRDHHTGRGTLAADWPATWRTWMRNALKFSRPPFGQAPINETAETMDVWKWRLKVFEKGDEENKLAPGYWKAAWGPKPGETGCRAPQ